MTGDRYLLNVNGWYYARFRVNGKWQKHSLHTKDLEEAREKRDALIGDLVNREDDKKVLQSVKRKLAGIEAEEEEERKSPKGGIHLSKAFEVFARDADRRPCGARQMETHKNNWKKFLEWLAAVYPAIHYCREVTQGIAKEWSSEKLADVRATSTYNKHLSTVHYVFEVICGMDEELRNPFAHIHKRQEKDLKCKQPFTDDELKAIFALPDEEFKRLCAIGLYTTLRLTSARCLKWEQYDGEYIHAIHEKTGADATMRVPEELKYWLDRVPQAERQGYICPTYAVKPWANASQLVQSMLQKAGIQTQRLEAGINGKVRTVCIKGFHSFRHTAITKSLQNGATTTQVKRLAGHSSERMQEHYTHFGADDAGNAASKIGRFW